MKEEEEEKFLSWEVEEEDNNSKDLFLFLIMKVAGVVVVVAAVAGVLGWCRDVHRRRSWKKIIMQARVGHVISISFLQPSRVLSAWSVACVITPSTETGAVLSST